MAQENRKPGWPLLVVFGRKLRKSKLLFVLLPLLVLVALNTKDYWWSLVDREQGCGSPAESVSWSDEFFYNHLQMRHGHAPRYKVTLVTISDEERSDLLTNVCVGRWFTADLLDALNRRGVSVVALDKVYGEKSCSEDGARVALVGAIARSKARVVVGQGTQPTKVGGDCLVKTTGLELGANVVQGITKVNQDDRKIPLEWPLLTIGRAASKGEQASQAKNDESDGKGFAFLTATAADPNVATKTELVKNMQRHSHPFGDFRKTIEVIPAREVLCSDADGAKAFRHWGGKCDTSPPVDLYKHVVVVGDVSDRDMQPFIGGEIPGALLQAHYVDALLSERYISELPFYGCVIAFGLWVLGTELWLVMTEEKERANVLVWITGIFCVISVLLTVGLQETYVMPPVSFLIAASVVLLFDWTAELIARGRKRVLSV